MFYNVKMKKWIIIRCAANINIGCFIMHLEVSQQSVRYQANINIGCFIILDEAGNIVDFDKLISTLDVL